MSASIDHVIACQDRLLGAIDALDAPAIEAATVELAAALGALGSEGAFYGLEPGRLDHAMRQAEAARIRVNVLSDWTRQRIDRLGEIRSGSAITYSNKGINAPVA